MCGAEIWTLQSVDRGCLESYEMCCWRRMEIGWTDRVRNEGVLLRGREGGAECRTVKRRKAKGKLDWSHLAWELPSETLC